MGCRTPAEVFHEARNATVDRSKLTEVHRNGCWYHWHVGSNRRPLSPELRTTPPPHQDTGNAACRITHLPSEVHLHSLGSVFILVLGHGLMSRRTHRSPPCRNVDVKVSSSQSDGPSPPVGLRWHPAPTGLTNSVPLRSASHPLCPEPYDVSHHSPEGPILAPQRVYHPHRHTGVAAAARSPHSGAAPSPSSCG